MSDSKFQLGQAPIIEAVLDIDCDLPVTVNRDELEKAARAALHGRYPHFKQQFIQTHLVTSNGEEPPQMKTNEVRGAMQFFTEDRKQLVQFRPNGFSFNRLAPYTTLDDYLPDIEAAWHLFEELAHPVQIRKVGLRMINRMLLPMEDGQINFSEFLQVSPRLPATGLRLMFSGFLDQHLAVDMDTKNQVNIVKTTEMLEGDKLPMILDIEAFHESHEAPPAWPELLERIQSLRNLKNRVFQHTLTPRCLNLFSSA
jgi:uncharacterized protein (TIGR04255 family)